MTEIDDVLRTSFATAESLDFPMFVGPERESNPVNSTPYVAHLSDAREGRILVKRQAFLRELIAVLEELPATGVRPVAVLIGGSVIGPKPNPSDLDGVVFYELLTEESANVEALRAFQRSTKARRLDLRLIPIDGDPLILLKAASFFTALYCKNRDEDRIVRGLVLLDCREERRSDKGQPFALAGGV